MWQLLDAAVDRMFLYLRRVGTTEIRLACRMTEERVLKIPRVAKLATRMGPDNDKAPKDKIKVAYTKFNVGFFTHQIPTGELVEGRMVVLHGVASSKNGSVDFDSTCFLMKCDSEEGSYWLPSHAHVTAILNMPIRLEEDQCDFTKEESLRLAGLSSAAPQRDSHATA